MEINTNTANTNAEQEPNSSAVGAQSAELTYYDKLEQFKTLLEYFVYHLEFIQDQNYVRQKYATFITNKLGGNSELQDDWYGLGYKYPNGGLQNCIKKWSSFVDDSIYITVDPRSTTRLATGWFLAWRNAPGANVKTVWSQGHIERLYLSIRIGDDSHAPKEPMSFTLNQLGLFEEGVEPNQNLKSFFDGFEKLKYEFWQLDEEYHQKHDKKPNISTEFNGSDHMLDELYELITNNKNVILTGAPGTGKTYLAGQLTCMLVGAQSAKDKQFKHHVKFVQFHPSYDYTDFVEGLRPVNKDGQLGFERKDGIFKTLCKAALAAPTENFVMIIDEINRGQVSKIFGELFFALDPDYRGEEGRGETQYQNMVTDEDFKDGFYVPENVYVIGTMNDIDHSLEPLDFAFRRRFAWYEILAEKRFDSMFKGDEPFKSAPEFVKKVKLYFDRLNKAIGDDSGFGTAYQVGPAYFLKLKNFIKDIPVLDAATDAQVKACMKKLWNIHLKPLLVECLKVNSDTTLTIKDLEKAYLSSKPNEDSTQSGESDIGAQG